MTGLMEQAVRLRGEGLTQMAIAARIGIPQPRVSELLAKAGRGGRLVDSDRCRRNERILRLRGEGLTQAQIGSHVGLSQTRVGDILQRVDATDRKVVEQHARAREIRARAADLAHLRRIARKRAEAIVRLVGDRLDEPPKLKRNPGGIWARFEAAIAASRAAAQAEA